MQLPSNRVIWLTLNKADLEDLKGVYQAKVTEGIPDTEPFEWRGYTLLMGYAKYGIEFLEQRFAEKAA